MDDLALTERRPRRDRTPAQWYCLLVGGTLLLIGLLGFIADASFDVATDAPLNGDSFLGFEVNGWHNLVHVASGLLLLAAANTAPSAKTLAIGFGFVYAIVALWGLIDGNDVLGVIPVNAADNLLHIALSVVGIVAGLASRTFKRDFRRRKTEPQATTTTGHEPELPRERTGRFDREAETAAERDPTLPGQR